ncbi:hypothetical protein NKH74_34050 [Mesorhizobium sp. M0933]|uniref:hypothetical protein n=1 Tax=Mesorhizobium sp. M0933 TaxID=2957030 RepID=UPI00333B7F9E
MLPYVGLLRLDEPVNTDPKPRELDHPDNFDWPVVTKNVPGASVEAIVNADPKLCDPFVESARFLEERGAKLIISNCGFTVAYDKLIRESVSVPVATSSLLLLPFLKNLLSQDGRIGILTFDASKLTDQHLEAAWPSLSKNSIRSSGLEGSVSWKKVTEHGHYDWDQILEDSLEALQELCDDETVEIVLVECCALCSFVPQYQLRARRPVFDAIAMARMIIAASGLGVSGIADNVTK